MKKKEMQKLAIRIAEELIEDEHIYKTEWNANRNFIITCIFNEIKEMLEEN